MSKRTAWPIPSRPSYRRNTSSTSSYKSSYSRRSPQPLLPEADTFSYDPAYLATWTMPPHLWDKLPSSLIGPVSFTQHAGAAVATALARIERLRGKAVLRAWNDDPTPTTRFSSFSLSRTPSSEDADPPSSDRPDSRSGGGLGSTFDQEAWDTYLCQFNAEISELKSDIIVRLRHGMRNVDKVLLELWKPRMGGGDVESEEEGWASAEQEEAFREGFRVWWEGRKDVVRGCEERVRGVRCPGLGDVKSERLELGLGL